MRKLLFYDEITNAYHIPNVVLGKDFQWMSGLKEVIKLYLNKKIRVKFILSYRIRKNIG